MKKRNTCPPPNHALGLKRKGSTNAQMLDYMVLDSNARCDDITSMFNYLDPSEWSLAGTTTWVHRQGCFIPHFLQSFACSLRWSRSLIANVREKQSDTEYCILRCTAHRPFKWQRGSKSCLSMDVLISNLRSVVHGQGGRAAEGRKRGPMLISSKHPKHLLPGLHRVPEHCWQGF